jgi:hypothetical protein
MLTLYLVCLMFGGTLLSISLFMGGDHDTDHGDIDSTDGDFHLDGGESDIQISGDVEADIGGDVDLDVGDTDVDLSDAGDVDLDVDATADVSTDVEVDSGADGIQHAEMEPTGKGKEVARRGEKKAFKFLSLRSLIFFTAFFGLTGSILTWLGIGYTLTLASAICLGGGSSVLTYKLMNYFKRTESGDIIDLKELEGHSAKVILSPTKTRKGKISLEIKGRTLTLLALIDDDADMETLPMGAWALIVSVKDQVAYIINADYMN